MATYGGYLSKLQIGNKYYDIFDKEAREMLSQVLVFAGVTTAAITDNASTPSTYGGLTGISTYPIDPTTGEPHIATDTIDNGTVVIYDSKEFVWQGGKWHEFGDLYEWTPTLTKDSVLGANTAFTPATTSTMTDRTAHAHAILKNDIVQAFQVTNVHAAASAPTFTPTTTDILTGVNSDGAYLATTTITPVTFTSGTATNTVFDTATTASKATAETKKDVAKAGTAVNAFTSIAASGTTNKVLTGVTKKKLATSGYSWNAGAFPVYDYQASVVTGVNSNTTSTDGIEYLENASIVSNNDGTNTNTLVIGDIKYLHTATGSQSLTSAGTVPSLTLPSSIATGSLVDTGTGGEVVVSETPGYL